MQNIKAQNIKTCVRVSVAKICLLFLAAILAQLLSYESVINLYDEGIILSGAHALLHGKLPYKDFWTMYGPGQFYLLAWVFSIFGETNIAARCIGLVSKASIAILIFLINRRLVGAYSYCAMGVVICLLIMMGQDAFPIFPSLAFSIAAILFAEKGISSRNRYFIFAGICTGLSACFRHDLGFYSAIGFVLSLSVMHGFEWQKKLQVFLCQMGLYSAGLVLVVGPVIIYFLKLVPVSDLIENLITIPSQVYPKVRALPWPTALPLSKKAAVAFSVYVPFVVGGIGLLVSIIEISKLRNHRVSHFFKTIDHSFLWILVVVTCVLFTIKGVIRVEPLHMVQSLALAVPITTGLLNYSSTVDVKYRAPLHFFLGASAALLLLLAVQGAQNIGDGIKNIIKGRSDIISECLHPEILRARCARVDADYIAAIHFIATHTSRDDSIYVGASRHDKVFINAVALYFLTDRLSATKWYELHPGVQTQERIQREMIKEFERKQPKYMILDGRWEGVVEPNDSSKPSGVVLLDKYIQDKYRPVQTSGAIQILERVIRI